MRHLLFLAFFPLLFMVGCSGESPVAPEESLDASIQAAKQGPPVTGSADLLVITGLTVDVNNMTVIPVIAPPSTLLYYRRNRKPVLAPDGHHVTAGEFSAVQGSISVKCLPSGTQVKVHLRELIPNATYRIWLLTFKDPGFDIGPPPDFSNVVGEGALGPNDRSRNTFKASASGQGQITRIHPAGLLSEFLPAPAPFPNEPAGDCLLTDHFEWHAFGAFQQPGEPGGPDVGPPAFFPDSAVEQFVFVFRQ